MQDQASAQTTSQCVTADTALLSQTEQKTHDPWNGKRADLLEMFTRSYHTMTDTGTYTVSDIKARPDKQGAEWQRRGPNALWNSIYC